MVGSAAGAVGTRSRKPLQGWGPVGEYQESLQKLEAAEQADEGQRHSVEEHEGEAGETVARLDWGTGCVQGAPGTEVQEASVCTPCLRQGQAWPCTTELTPPGSSPCPLPFL